MLLPCLAWRSSLTTVNTAASTSRLLRTNFQRRKQLLPSSRLIHLVHLQRAATYHALPTSSVSPDTHSSEWLTRSEEENSHSKEQKQTEEDDDEWAVNSSVRSSRSTAPESGKTAKEGTSEPASSSESVPEDRRAVQASVEGTTPSSSCPSESNATTSGSDHNNATVDDVTPSSPAVSKNNDSALFPSKSAAGLDLSSSLLIQHMLFSKNEHEETSTPPPTPEQTTSLPLEHTIEPPKDTTSNHPSTIPRDPDQLLTDTARPCTEIPLSNAPESHANINIPINGADSNAASKMSPESEADLSHKLDIRVGKILFVEHHTNAESLYVEQVDVGDGTECSTEDLSLPKSRTIVSGLVKYIDKDGLKDRNVVVVRNMKPTKLRGIVSEGMLLCAEHEGKVELLEPPAESPPGERVYFEGLEKTDDNSTPSLLNPKRKIFETVAQDFSTNTLGVALYKGKFPFRTRHGLVTVKTIREGGKIR